MAQTIVLFSTKGGTGKTLISANLAFSLAKLKKKVLLIDGDLDVVGNMAWMLNVSPNRSMADVMYLLKRKKVFDIGEYITKKYQNVHFLPCILKPQQSSHFDPDLIREVIEPLRENYDYIIIDGGKAFSESLIRFFDEANLFSLIVTPDVISVYQTKWALDTLQSLYFPLKMLKIVLNRAESLASISLQEIKLVFPCEVIAKVPSEGKTAMLSVNKKVLLVNEFPFSKIAASIKQFAKDLVDRSDIFLQRKEIKTIKGEFAKKKDLWEKQGLKGNLESELKEDQEYDEISMLKQKIHQKLIENLNLKKMDYESFSEIGKAKEIRKRAERLIGEFLAGETHSLIGSVETRKKLTLEIIDEALGYGPLEDLLKNQDITDIMVNNKDEIYIEERGKLQLTSKRFVSNEQVKTVIERIIAPIGRRIDESSPYVDARLPDGSRVNAIISPLVLTGPTLTIRKFRKERFKLKELIEYEALSEDMGKFIEACVLARKNIIVSGGTGSGKTTVLNILSSFIPDDERIITIEDAAELKLDQRHWVRLESRPPNIEGKGAIAIRDLFKNTLRMRPDRIIVGECRGVESLDMLQAMNTGHDGSMTTIHANSTHDILTRLDSMILMSGVELPLRAIREMIASAIHIIVHTQRLSDGSRKVVQVTELTELDDDMHISLKDVFKFNQTGLGENGEVQGYFGPTGYIPSFYDEIKVRGIPLLEEIFKPK
ncbi:MAG: Flp pilus assembly complex ATPase component [Candidatus Omnitrophica bacterium]|nr:Flp pilus assembly complex ATPase component [Candidatus Omnitrophota bacterium]